MKMQVARGSDIPVDITLKDADGNAIQPNSLLDIAIIIYAKVTGKVLGKFRSSAPDGWGEVGIVNNTTGAIRVTIESDESKVADMGTYVMDIKLKFSDDSVSDSEFDSIISQVEVFELIDSRLKDA